MRIFTVTTSMLVGLAALTGCSGPGEDVRIQFCKDLMLTQLDAPQTVRWTSSRAVPRGHEDLAVTLRFEAEGSGGTPTQMEAVCYYRYNAVDDTAVTLADPLSAYSTSPSRATLNGRELSRQGLATAVKDAVIDQGKALIDRGKALIDQARQ